MFNKSLLNLYCIILFSSNCFSNWGVIDENIFKKTNEIKLINSDSIDLIEESLNFYIYRMAISPKNYVTYPVFDNLDYEPYMTFGNISDYVNVKIQYKLKNTVNSPQKVKIGFPVDFEVPIIISNKLGKKKNKNSIYEGLEERILSTNTNYQIKLFNIKEKNKSLNVSENLKINYKDDTNNFKNSLKENALHNVKYIPVRKWYTASLNFKPNETKIIDIHYRFLPKFFSESVSFSFEIWTGKRSFSYDFSPASSWKNKLIEKFELNIYFDDERYEVHPTITNKENPESTKTEATSVILKNNIQNNKQLPIFQNFEKNKNNIKLSLNNFNPEKMKKLFLTFQPKENKEENKLRSLIKRYDSIMNYTADSFEKEPIKSNPNYSFIMKTNSEIEGDKNRIKNLKVYTQNETDSFYYFKYIYSNGTGNPKIKLKNIKASSNLENYPVSNLFDKDYSTAWVEGNIEQGIGETIRLEFSRYFILDKIFLVNGYQKSLKTYVENNVIKKLKVSTSSGCNYNINFEKVISKIKFNEEMMVDKKDSLVTSEISHSVVDCGNKNYLYFIKNILNVGYPKKIPLNQVPINWIEFEILDIYPGTKYNDTAITEILILPKISDY